MPLTNLTKREVHNPNALLAKLNEHDTAIDDLQVSGAGLVADGSITTAKLDDGAVTEDKLANESVTHDKIATAVITGDKMMGGLCRGLLVTAGNGSGARTATGLRVGDEVSCCVNLTDLANDRNDFEPVVSVEDQLQQLSGNHTGDTFLVMVVVKSGQD